MAVTGQMCQFEGSIACLAMSRSPPPRTLAALPTRSPPRPTTESVHTLEPSSDDELLTVHDAARFLNVSVSWVYEHTRDNVEDRLPVVKLGKYLRFDAHDLRAYVDAKTRSDAHPRRR